MQASSRCFHEERRKKPPKLPAVVRVEGPTSHARGRPPRNSEIGDLEAEAALFRQAANRESAARAKAVAVTRRDKKRGGEYSVKEAIEAIDQAFHRCTGFDPYDGSKLNPKLLGEYDNKASKAKGCLQKRDGDAADH